MRFVSKFGRFGVQIRPQIQEAYATGMARVIQEPVYALFHPDGLLPVERELAMATWCWNGFYQEQDEVTIVQPDYRIGVFDTDVAAAEHGWSQEVKAEVEAGLLDHAARYDDIIAVARQSADPPWPRYDDYGGTLNALVRKLVDEGHDLEQVIDYERAHQDRPKLVSALEALLESPEQLAALREEEVVG